MPAIPEPTSKIPVSGKPSDKFCCEPILTSMLDDSTANQLASVLKILADPVRLKLVSYIASAGRCCAQDLETVVDKSQPTISHHLAQLVKAGILQREQEGKSAYYEVDQHQVNAIASMLC